MRPNERPVLTLEMNSPAGLHARRTARALITAKLTDEAVFLGFLNDEVTGQVDATFLYGTIVALTQNAATLVKMFSNERREETWALYDGLSPEVMERAILAALAIGDENLAERERRAGEAGANSPGS